MNFYELLFMKNLVGAGMSDYDALTNKPAINGHTLSGDMSAEDLGLASAADLAKLKVINENPENHNGIYRGKNLTNVYTIEQIYERVHGGSFEDLYLGDYITVSITTDLYTRFTGAAFESGVTYYEMGGTVIERTWTETQDAEPQSGKVYATKQVITEDVDLMIAHFDYYLNVGPDNGYVDKHHVVLIPKGLGFKTASCMHSIVGELTGYKGSDMHNITLPCYAASLKSALSNHVLVHNLFLTNIVDDSMASMFGAGQIGATKNVASENTELAIPNENQLFGNSPSASSAFDRMADRARFAVFNFIPLLGLEKYAFNDRIWTRTISYMTSGHVAYSIIRGSEMATIAAESNANPHLKPYMLFG